jgi:hypothetical protein
MKKKRSYYKSAMLLGIVILFAGGGYGFYGLRFPKRLRTPFPALLAMSVDPLSAQVSSKREIRVMVFQLMWMASTPCGCRQTLRWKCRIWVIQPKVLP